MAYCDELLFGILFPCYYRNIETMNVISSDTEISRNKHRANITSKLSIITKEIFLPHFQIVLAN